MDSKNIYIACSHMLAGCRWENHKDGNEWRSVGDGTDFRTAEVQKEIDEYFSASPLFVVADRHNSAEVPARRVAEHVAGLIGNGVVVVCEKDFSRFMQFNPIGVSRRGVAAS